MDTTGLVTLSYQEFNYIYGGEPIFFQGENPAVHGGREADNCLSFHRRLQAEYPTTSNLY